MQPRVAPAKPKSEPKREPKREQPIMSGILLPGQEKKPQSQGSGLELPKGFSRRRDQEEAPAAQPTAPAPTQPAANELAVAVPPAAPAPAPRAPRRGQGADGSLFPPTGAQIQCPNCRTPYTVPVFSIIDLGANPELKGPLLGGQINIASVPELWGRWPFGRSYWCTTQPINFWGSLRRRPSAAAIGCRCKKAIA